MMTADKNYQGWTNYETWCIALWIGNEQGSHNYWLEQAEEIFRRSKADNVLTQSERARFDLADQLKSEIEDGAPELNGMYADLLTAAISEANWSEIANSFFKDVEGYEQPK